MPRLDKDSEVRKAIAGAIIPAGKREVMMFDSGHKKAIPGFGVRVFASGRASFILKYVVGKGPHARTRRMSLGEVASNNLDQQLSRLRQMADDIRDTGRVLGRDLIGEKQAEAAAKAAAQRESEDAPTLRKLAPDYLRDRKRGRNERGKELKKLKVKSLVETARYLKGTTDETGKVRTESVWKDIADVPLARITMRQLQDILETVARKRGAVTADRARVALSGFFGWAIDLRYVDANPTNDLGHQSLNTPRERVLSEAELVEVWKACGDDDHGRIVRLLMLTGQRRAEIGDLAHSEIDREKRQIELPPPRTKNGLPHIIPLAPEALALLPAKAEDETRDFVFGERAGGYGGWSKSKAELDQRIAEARAIAGQEAMPAWVLHDLRRSFVTHISETGIAQPHIVEAIVNHVSGHKGGVAGIYNRAVYLPEKREALQPWATYLTGLVGKPALIDAQSVKPGSKRRATGGTSDATAG
jgi:integrase